MKLGDKTGTLEIILESRNQRGPSCSLLVANKLLHLDNADIEGELVECRDCCPGCWYCYSHSHGSEESLVACCHD